MSVSQSTTDRTKFYLRVGVNVVRSEIARTCRVHNCERKDYPKTLMICQPPELAKSACARVLWGLRAEALRWAEHLATRVGLCGD